MAETAPEFPPTPPEFLPTPPLDTAAARAGRAGPDGRAVRVIAATGCGLVTVMTRPDHQDDLARRLDAGLGLSLPGPGASVESGELHLLWAGLDKWYVQAPEMSGPALLARLAAVCEGVPAALADQSHGQVPLRIDGPGAADLLAAGAPLDLTPAVFGVGRVAATALSHVPVLIWHRREQDYQVLVQRGFARELWDFLAAHVATG